MVVNVGRGMTSPSLDCTHGRQHRACHDITALGKNTRSNDVGRGMRSSPLGSTDDRTTSRVACDHSPWTANTAKQRQGWHAIIAFGQHKRSNDIGHGMPSSPLDYKHGRTVSGLACHHHLWAALTVGRRLAWHAIIAIGQHTQSNDVGRGMTSPPLDCTHGRQHRACYDITALGKNTRSNDVGRGMPSSPLGSTHGRTTSRMACDHSLWTTNTVNRRQGWHAIIAFGQHKRSNDVGRGMPS